MPWPSGRQLNDRLPLAAPVWGWDPLLPRPPPPCRVAGGLRF